MTENAQAGTPFEGAARSQTWVMRSLSPWIRRMAAGPASRAFNSSRLPIGAQTAQHANWISRRAERIEHAAAWSGELGRVSPALVDRFSQRVANRVQRSARPHQVDAYAGGDNLDAQLDMPLVTNEGQLTPLSEGGSDETPFAFGAFSPEHVQRKPAATPAEAPPAAPPMSTALRERAEQLRRSLATNTPAPTPAPQMPAIEPASRAPAIQPSRTPAPPAAAPRAGVMRARPATRIEELGPGSAPKPAPPMPPVPEPPPAHLQRAPQAPAQTSAPAPTPRPTPTMPTPNIQRSALPPQVVQGQGRLTQMLNARFKPKLEQARNPDAPRTEANVGDDFTGAADVTSDNAPHISRSTLPPADRSAPDVSDDLPVPTPKPRLLRKPALPTAPKPATPASTSLTVPSAQRNAPATPSPEAMPQSTDAPSTASSTGAAPQVQRQAEPPAQAPRENISADTPRSEPAAIQREVKMDASRDVDLLLAASASPASKVEASVDAQTEPPASSDAPSVQRDVRESALPAAQTPSTKTPAPPAEANIVQREVKTDAARDVDLPLASPASKAETSVDAQAEPPAISAAPVVQREMRESASPAVNIIQRSTTPASEPPQQAETPAEPGVAAPIDLTLQTPRSVADASVESPAETVQREAVTEKSTPVAGDVIQRDMVTPASVSDAAPAQRESRLPIVETPEAVQRMAVNAPPPADVPSADVADVDQAMPLVQRAPASDDVADAPMDGSPAQPFSATSTIQRKSEPAKNETLTSEPQRNVDAPTSERSMGVIQRAVTPPANEVDALTLQTPATRATNAPASDAPLPSSAQTPQVASMKTGAPAIQREPSRSAVSRSEATPAQHSAKVPIDPPAIQRSSTPEMVLRSPARGQEASVVMDESSFVTSDASFVNRDAPAGNAIAVREPPAVVRRQAAAKSISRMAGVAMADMPVLRAVAVPSAEAAMPPEARTLAMPIVQRAAVKHEQQTLLAAQVRPVNPFVVAQEKASAMPVVQRAPAKDAPDVQRVEVEEPVVAAEKDVAQTPAQDRAISDAELTKAAQRLLPIIKRMLMLERERLFGR